MSTRRSCRSIARTADKTIECWQKAEATFSSVFSCFSTSIHLKNRGYCMRSDLYRIGRQRVQDSLESSVFTELEQSQILRTLTLNGS